MTGDKHEDIKISATGNAIVKALIFIENAKREIEFDLYQQNSIHSLEIEDIEASKNKPKIEGLDDDEQPVRKRRVTAMDTVLSKKPLDESHVGYQPPLTNEQREQHKLEK